MRGLCNQGRGIARKRRGAGLDLSLWASESLSLAFPALAPPGFDSASPEGTRAALQGTPSLKSRGATPTHACGAPAY